jgi:hypothetical protein
MKRGGAFVAALTLALGCQAPERPPPEAPASPKGTVLDLLADLEPPPEAPKDTNAVLTRSLPGVLLVLNQRTDGKTGFGSALLLPGNLALTNRHVVENSQSLSVMFHDPKRPSHGGLEEEGGLRRYVFENEKALVRAEIVREDVPLDLAVIRVHAITAGYPRLAWRTEPARSGERVYAVGHPAQNVWSFTAGQISNTHVTSIQLDLAINEGNSGGPLLDARGQVLGINTSRALGGTQNIGYARPIGLAKSIVEGSSQSAPLDLSSPDKASASCARAAEIGDPSWADCEDFDSAAEYSYELKRRATADIGNPSVLVESNEFDRTHPPIEVSRELSRRARAAFIRGDQRARAESFRENKAIAERYYKDTPHGKNPFEKLSRAELLVIKDKIAAAQARFRAFGPVLMESVIKRTGLQKISTASWMSVENETLRMGKRVDKTAKVDASHAWVAVSGLNKDGSRYQFSEFWTERNGQWREIRTPMPAQAATLPAGFPPTPFDAQEYLTQTTDWIIARWAAQVLPVLGQATPAR